MVIRHAKPVVHPEDLQVAVKNLISRTDEWDVLLAEDAPEVPSADRPDDSDGGIIVDESADEYFIDLMISALQDEIVPAVETSTGNIRESEVQQELVKKALVGLKLQGLKRVARQLEVRVGGSTEQLAERIAKRVGWDESEVARLIVENADDVRPEQGYSTRIFPVELPIDRAYVTERLRYVVGRYIRTAVARWFVFEDFKEDDNSIVMSGALQTLTAGVSNVLGKEPSLTARPNTDSVTLSLADSGLADVRGGTSMSARAAVSALETACRVKTLGYIRGIDASAKAPRGELHSASLFVLDVLATRLPDKGINESQVTVARFRVKKDADLPWDAEQEAKPRLKAVRLEGDYLFDSTAACRLLAAERRPLTDVTIQITTRDEDEKIDGRFPMRIAIERDHVSVETSFGYGNQDKSRDLHDAAVAAVRDELLSGPGSLERLKTVVAQIEARAAQPDDGESE